MVVGTAHKNSVKGTEHTGTQYGTTYKQTYASVRRQTNIIHTYAIHGAAETGTSKKMSYAVAASAAAKWTTAASFAESAEAWPRVEPQLDYCVAYKTRYC